MKNKTEEKIKVLSMILAAALSLGLSFYAGILFNFSGPGSLSFLLNPHGSGRKVKEYVNSGFIRLSANGEVISKENNRLEIKNFGYEKEGNLALQIGERTRIVKAEILEEEPEDKNGTFKDPTGKWIVLREVGLEDLNKGENIYVSLELLEDYNLEAVEIEILTR